MSCPYGLAQSSVLSFDLTICLRPVWCDASVLNCMERQEFFEFSPCKLCGVVRNNCLWKSMSGKYPSQTLHNVASRDVAKNTHLHPSCVIVRYDQQMLAWRKWATCINGNNLGFSGNSNFSLAIQYVWLERVWEMPHLFAMQGRVWLVATHLYQFLATILSYGGAV